MMFVKFVFRAGLAPILIKFPDNDLYEQFVAKVKLIIRFNWLQEPNQFIMKQNTPDMISDAVRLQNSDHEWLQNDRMKLIDKLSQKMRENHTGITLNEPIQEITLESD